MIRLIFNKTQERLKYGLFSLTVLLDEEGWTLRITVLVNREMAAYNLYGIELERDCMYMDQDGYAEARAGNIARCLDGEIRKKVLEVAEKRKENPND